MFHFKSCDAELFFKTEAQMLKIWTKKYWFLKTRWHKYFLNIFIFVFFCDIWQKLTAYSNHEKSNYFLFNSTFSERPGYREHIDTKNPKKKSFFHGFVLTNISLLFQKGPARSASLDNFVCSLEGSSWVYGWTAWQFFCCFFYYALKWV